MAKLNIMDVVSLAKAGFKYQEIKDLMSIDIPEQTTQTQPPEVAQEPETETEHPAPDDTETPAKATGQPVESTEDQKKIEELEKQIAELQKKNQSTDISGNIPDSQETLNEIVRGFM